MSGKGTGTEKGWKGFGERRQKKKWEGFGERRWRKGKVAEERAEQAGLGKKPLVTGSAQLIDNKHKIIVIDYNFNKCSTLYFLCLWDKAPVTWHFQCTQGQWTFKWTSPIVVPGRHRVGGGGVGRQTVTPRTTN